MKYQVYVKKLDGSVEEWNAPCSLERAMNTVKGCTRMENSKSNKWSRFMYWYCLPIKED